MTKRRRDRTGEGFDPLPEDFGENLERQISQRIQMKLSEKLGTRDNAVMTRLSDDALEKLDALVELEVFRSRSEAVAFFVREGMQVREDLFASVMPTMDKIRQLKEHAKRSLEQKPSVPGEIPDEGEE